MTAGSPAVCPPITSFLDKITTSTCQISCPKYLCPEENLCAVTNRAKVDAPLCNVSNENSLYVKLDHF